MRPVYETSSDITNEEQVKAVLVSMWDVQFHKLPRFYFVDWILIQDGKAKAFAELKCRNNPRDKYPTLMLSLHKWMHGKAMAQEIDGAFLVIVRWEDGIYYHKQGWCEVSYGIGGRTDRSDKEDVEPVVFIPIDSFKRINKN